MRSLSCTLLLVFGIAAPSSAADASPIEKQLAIIKAVGPEGAGNAEAAAAWKNIVGTGLPALMPTLTAMDNTKPAIANWLRLAAQAIVEAEAAAKRPIPAKELETFVRDTTHGPVGRRLAYEFLVQADPKAPERILKNLTDDPSFEIRRDAIDHQLPYTLELFTSRPMLALKNLQGLFDSSRDLVQAEKIAKALKEHGVTVDLNEHFGVQSSWMLVGPFDSPQGTGYDKVYEPEKKVDLSAAYKGKKDAEIKWIPTRSVEPYGLVDLNKALGKHKDAVAYAFTSIEAAKEAAIEIRFGCISAVKLFLNGKELYATEEYHHGQRFDQYVAVGNLKPGRNEILLKICQNNQTENWAQDWKFQLRVCDSLGGALPIKSMNNP